MSRATRSAGLVILLFMMAMLGLAIPQVESGPVMMVLVLFELAGLFGLAVLTKVL